MGRGGYFFRASRAADFFGVRAGIAVNERSYLKVEQDVAPQHAMVEHQINVIVFIGNTDAELAGFEAKAGAQFKEEGLQVVKERLFQVAFVVFGTCGEAGEFEDVGVAD